jgi:ferredoxin
MFSREHRIYIEGSKEYYTVKTGTNLYKFLIENKLITETLCKGQGQCGRCKALIKSASGKDINKPTKRDKLLLAAVNLQAGYRLTCQYLVKSDIIVRVEKTEGSIVDSEFISVRIKKQNATPTSEDKSENKLGEKLDNEGENLEEKNLEESIINNSRGNLDIEEVYEELKNKNHYNDIITNVDTMETEVGYNPTDGLILLQYNKGIKYYIYSAGIANISSEGLIRTNETLLDIIDNNVISDFIYNNIHLNDLERLIIILDNKYFEGENLFNLVNYYTVNIGTMVCEIIQPQNNPLDLLLFFRLLYNNKRKNIFISLELLSRIYYFNEGTLYEINTNEKTIEDGLQKLLESSNNPIINIDENFEITIKDKYEMPDKIHFKALLQTIKLLKMEKLISEDFELKDRLLLVDNVPINRLVKLSNKDGKPIFFIYRKKNLEFYIDQDTLDLIYCCSQYINVILKIIKSNLKRIDSIYVFTTEKYENLINDLFDLSIIPQDYSKKIVYFSGEPSILTSKFFQYKSIKDYFAKNITSFESINLKEDKIYLEFKDIIRKRVKK